MRNKKKCEEMEINKMRGIKITSIILLSLLLIVALTSQVFAYYIPGTNIEMENPYIPKNNTQNNTY